jgi:hypothetical protein
MPKSIVPFGQRSEHGGEHLASFDPPSEHVGVHSLRVVAHRADFYLLASQFAPGIDDECPRTGPNVDHYPMFEIAFVVVLTQEVLGLRPYNSAQPARAKS